ncbi:LysR family transcriptional regulator [Oscillospiraceae bacterium LTW-04]|nr:LysR family transcriptional regulator [Oscillospiraceae bacterium MB24-C1]
MDVISLYYFSELAKDLHMTRTANRLFITQQTLSNHIQRLEKYYGVDLLYRKPVLSLTCAGEFVLAFADVVNKENTNLKDILSDIKNQEKGMIRFGASTMRVNACLPGILPQFSKRYPDVEIRITDTISSKLEPMIINGQLDFAIIVSGEENSKLVSEHLMDDQVYLCVADSLLRQYYGDEIDDLKLSARNGANIKDFAKLPFCMLSNRMGRQIKQSFDEAGVTPKQYITSTYTQISSNLCLQRLAACFSSQMSLVNQQSLIPDDINIFPLYYRGEPMIQRLSLIRHKERYLSHYSKLFLELMFQYFSDVQQIRMDRSV